MIGNQDNEEEEEEGYEDGDAGVRVRHGGPHSSSWGSHSHEGGGEGSDISRKELLGEALYGVFPVLNALRAKR